MATLRVFHRQFMQAKLVLHLFQLVRRGVEQGYPDETVGALDVIADIVNRQVGQFFAILIGHAVNQHTVPQ